MKSQEFTFFVLKSFSVRPVRSDVIIPDFIVSRLAFSRFSENFIKSGSPSSSPRFFSAPVHAKIVAIGFVEVFSPFL